MKYSVYLRTFVHDEDFCWGEFDKVPNNTPKDKEGTLTMFMKWALSGLYGGDGTDIGEPFIRDMEKWLSENMKSEYAFNALGISNKTYVYGYFKTQEDAVLFKLTWAEWIM